VSSQELLPGQMAEIVPPEEPVQLVTFVFPGVGHRTGVCHLRWQKGRSVRAYLHQPPLRGQPILGSWDRCKAYNRQKQKVRLSYVPTPGDAVVITRVRR
jgi:hypothetical protein